jgi:hypothetical protein
MKFKNLVSEMLEEEKKEKDRIIELLEEMLKWIKVTSIPQVKKLLLDILSSDKEKIAYHYSDGRDCRAVAKLAGVHHGTVATWWKRWTRAGIAEPMGAKRGERARRIFSLEDFGIEVPSPKEVEPLKKEVETPTHKVITRESSEAKVTEGSAMEGEKLEESK